MLIRSITAMGGGVYLIAIGLLYCYMITRPQSTSQMVQSLQTMCSTIATSIILRNAGNYISQNADSCCNFRNSSSYHFPRCWQSWCFEMLAVIISKKSTSISCWDADEFNFRNADKYKNCWRIPFWNVGNYNFPKRWQSYFHEVLAVIISGM